MSPTRTHDFSAAYDASLNAQFQQHSQKPETVTSSGKSAYSVETSSSKEKKDKVIPKSEVRVYGRGTHSTPLTFHKFHADDRITGGAQNIGKKVKEKEQKKESKPAKTGGFRGLKGIM